MPQNMLIPEVWILKAPFGSRHEWGGQRLSNRSLGCAGEGWVCLTHCVGAPGGLPGCFVELLSSCSAGFGSGQAASSWGHTQAPARNAPSRECWAPVWSHPTHCEDEGVNSGRARYFPRVTQQVRLEEASLGLADPWPGFFPEVWATHGMMSLPYT